MKHSVFDDYTPPPREKPKRPPCKMHLWGEVGLHTLMQNDASRFKGVVPVHVAIQPVGSAAKSNKSNVKSQNERVIAAMRDGLLTAEEIAEETGFGRRCVTGALSKLRAIGVVEHCGRDTGQWRLADGPFAGNTERPLLEVRILGALGDDGEILDDIAAKINFRPKSVAHHLRNMVRAGDLSREMIRYGARSRFVYRRVAK